MSGSAQVIGIDLGGTAIKLGRFDRQGRCLQSLVVPTPLPPLPERVVGAMVGAIAQLDPDRQCVAIGVGTPGPADVTGRIARVAINLGWQDVPLADQLEAQTGLPTVLANDANCAGLGESWLGAGRPFKDMILLTLGTGVGGAIILDGKLFVGRQGTGGELGLITLDWSGHPCNSGNRGSLEQHVSVQAVRRRTGLEPEELGRRAQAGELEAIAFWQTYGCELGAGLSSLIYVLTPEAIIIGGGVCASAGFFFPAMLEEIKARVLPSSREDLKVLVAALGNQAGIVGAAKLAWEWVDRQVQPTAEVWSRTNALLATQMQHFQDGFLARTAHELRSPLNSVISLQQLILSDLCDSPAEEREFVQQSYDAAQRMLKLLDHLIYVSKLQQGSLPLEMQPVSLRETLEEVQHLTHLQLRNRNYRFLVELPDESVYVMADPRGVRQVLVGLVEAMILILVASEQEPTAAPVPAAQPTVPGLSSLALKTAAAMEARAVHIDLLDEGTAQAWNPVWQAFQSPMPEPAGGRSPGEVPSPSFALLIARRVLEMMGGRLELAEPNSQTTPYRIRCSLPLILPDPDLESTRGAHELPG